MDSAVYRAVNVAELTHGAGFCRSVGMTTHNPSYSR
jgi:hypothetical protein